MVQTPYTSRHQADNKVMDYTPASATAGGILVNPGGGFMGATERNLAASEAGALALEGIRRYKKDGTTGPTFAVGDTIVWDHSANLAVALALGHDGGNDKACAICTKAATASHDFVEGMPIQAIDRHAAIRPFIQTVDCGVATAAAAATMIPAYMNMHGLVLVNAFALVVEAFAGATEDQGIVTLEDSDGTDICTFTAADASADAIGDILIGSLSLCQDDSGDLSGSAWKTVAAGKGVQVLATQLTSGAGLTGQMKVYAHFLPLL